MSRHLEYAWPDTKHAVLVLEENDGTSVATIPLDRSWRRMQWKGRQFRLAGRDRSTGEMIYLPEVEE